MKTLEEVIKNHEDSIKGTSLVKAMREALERLKLLADAVWESESGWDVSAEMAEMRDIINAALAAPPRNCDVGTAEEQAQRYAQYCDTYLRDYVSKPCSLCPCCGKIPFGRCEFAWAQMPYEEGGNK